MKDDCKYELVVRGLVVDVRISEFIDHPWRIDILSRMKKWCDIHGGHYEIHSKFVFDNEKQITMFLLRWNR